MEVLASYIAMSARLQQGGRVVGVGGRQGDAHGAADLHLEAVQRHRLLERAEDPAADPEHLVLVAGVRQEDRELVAAEPRDGAGRADRRAEPGGQLDAGGGRPAGARGCR